jgi:uncharacterized membrane protein SirB2
MLYVAVKHLHIACVALSIMGFCWRGMLLLKKSAQPLRAASGLPASLLAGRRWFRILPHINDSILLVAAITLTLLTGQYPFADAWLTAKIFGLIAYILLGALALKPGRSWQLRLAAGGAAIVVFGWIVSVALAKHPLGVLALLA